MVVAAFCVILYIFSLIVSSILLRSFISRRPSHLKTAQRGEVLFLATMPIVNTIFVVFVVVGLIVYLAIMPIDKFIQGDLFKRKD